MPSGGVVSIGYFKTSSSEAVRFNKVSLNTLLTVSYEIVGTDEGFSIRVVIQLNKPTKLNIYI